jgi:hypothetical protein
VALAARLPARAVLTVTVPTPLSDDVPDPGSTEEVFVPLLEAAQPAHRPPGQRL